MKTRTETWLALIAGAIGLLLVGLGGLWVFMSATPPLHPNAQAVTSEATTQGREIGRPVLAYILQALKRATIVGDQSAGAANLGGVVRLPESSTRWCQRTRNEPSGNWERTGVTPHVVTAGAEALDEALKAAGVAALKPRGRHRSSASTSCPIRATISGTASTSACPV